MPSIWDHDLWADIYAVKDAETQRILIRLYRLILDMHNKDVLSEQIAHALKGERKIYLSIGQKIGGFILAVLLAADAAANILHYFHHH